MKDFDTGYALGLCIVTADEIGDAYSFTMVSRINGEAWSRGNSGTMYLSLESLIAAISIDTTVYPGDVIGSGNVGGGYGLKLGHFLKDGNLIELEIEKIGVLRNRLVGPDAD